MYYLHVLQIQELWGGVPRCAAGNPKKTSPLFGNSIKSRSKNVVSDFLDASGNKSKRNHDFSNVGPKTSMAGNRGSGRKVRYAPKQRHVSRGCRENLKPIHESPLNSVSEMQSRIFTTPPGKSWNSLKRLLRREGPQIDGSF